MDSFAHLAADTDLIHEVLRDYASMALPIKL